MHTYFFQIIKDTLTSKNILVLDWIVYLKLKKEIPKKLGHFQNCNKN